MNFFTSITPKYKRSSGHNCLQCLTSNQQPHVEKSNFNLKWKTMFTYLKENFNKIDTFD